MLTFNAPSDFTRCFLSMTLQFMLGSVKQYNSSGNRCRLPFTFICWRGEILLSQPDILGNNMLVGNAKEYQNIHCLVKSYRSIIWITWHFKIVIYLTIPIKSLYKVEYNLIYIGKRNIDCVKCICRFGNSLIRIKPINQQINMFL